MPYEREQWEDVAFQVFEDMDGSIRSGYYPTGEGLVDGNVAINYVFGNFPIQPNDDRSGMFSSQKLGVLDSHDIASTEWNNYPSHSGPTQGSRNYVVTAAQYLGNNIYEFTSQNNLQVGDEVRTTNCPGFNGTAEVVYADATKFRTENEHEGSALITGLYGRVDVINEAWTGRTLESGNTFISPRIGLMNGATLQEAKVENYFNYLRELGVNPDFLKDLTFTGGDNEWDHVDGEPNYDGIVLYQYIPAEVATYDTPEGVTIYGSDLNGCILYSTFNTNEPIDSNSEYVEDFMVVVFSNDPRKDNQGWW